MEYLTIVGDGTTPTKDVPLTRDQIEHYKGRAAFLDGAYAKAAGAREGVELIRAGQESVGHEVGTAEPWMAGFGFGMMARGHVPYHPNLAGHTAVAEMLYEKIQASGSAR